MSDNNGDKTQATHADYQNWLLDGDNAQWVRYHQRCAHMALERAQWDFTGEDTMKNMYSSLSGLNTSYMEEKHQKLMNKGIVAVMTSLDGRNSGGFDNYIMNYVWKFGNSNLEHYDYGSERHKTWQRKNGVKSSIEDKFA